MEPANHGIAFYGWREPLGGGGSYNLTKNVYVAYNTITNWEKGVLLPAAIFSDLEVSGGIWEHNYILQSNSTCADGIQINAEPDHYPTGIIVRYNKVWMTTKPAFFADNADYAEVDIYYNLF